MLPRKNKTPLKPTLAWILLAGFCSTGLPMQTLVGHSGTAIAQTLFQANPEASDPENRVDVTFITEESRISESGETLWIGVHMEIQDGWHVYWRNPGDSGLPTRINWEANELLDPGDIHWPYPSRFDEDGVTTYGYSDNVTLLVPAHIRESTDRTTAQLISADLNWLVCKDICLPESAQLMLETDSDGSLLSFSESARGKIKDSKSRLPESSESWSAAASLENGTFKLTVISRDENANIPDPETIYFFPYKQGVIEHTSPQRTTRSADGLEIEMQASRYLGSEISELQGLLYSEDGWLGDRMLNALEITFPVN